MRDWPLYPRHPFGLFRCTPEHNSVFKCATRPYEGVVQAWVYALWMAGRLDTPCLVGRTLFVKGDGLQHKSGLLHVGFYIGEDKKSMSPYAQQDIVVGRLSEKNQLHMAYVAGQVRQLARWARAHGMTVRLGGDWEFLRRISTGLVYARTGQGIHAPSKRMPVPYNLFPFLPR